MTKSEFMESLERALREKQIADVMEIIEEYEGHFAFKMADGFSEEEIAAKLGDPVAIAAQFDTGTIKEVRCGKLVLARLGLSLTGLVAGLFFLLLAAWGMVVAIFSLISGAAAVALIAKLNIWTLIPPMPYGSAFLFGIAMAMLSLLSALALICYLALLRQLARVYSRFHHNTLAAASGKPILPSIALYPSFQPKVKRRLRRVAMIALSLFAVSFTLGLLVSMLAAGSLGFWHTWGWFGYKA